MAVFLLLALVISSTLFIDKTKGEYRQDSPKPRGEGSILGGSISENQNRRSSSQALLALLVSPSEITPNEIISKDLNYEIAAFGPLAASLKSTNQPVNYTRTGLITYRIKKSDTLSHIAARFGISVQTIISANPGISVKGLQIGQEIKILPTTGIIYEIQEGDTLESIASSFGAEPAYILEYNFLVDMSALRPGESIIIPGTNLKIRSASSRSSLPDLNYYFGQPAYGFNWGKLHKQNAVDIANSCDTPVVAAAQGLVVPDENYEDNRTGWNSGYGHFVLIEHPNNTKTRYAHLNTVLVEIGDFVKKGQQVGIMGNTGNVHGPTGCHLHFEVLGAQNPMAK